MKHTCKCQEIFISIVGWLLYLGIQFGFWIWVSTV